MAAMHEENMQKRAREVYELTVQIGALKEENSQVMREVEEVRIEYEERLGAQQARHQNEY
jgi:hypothetical protein